MHRINFLIIVFSIFSSVALSQDTINFNNIDLKTYGFAYYGEWDSVIHYGKLGLANDIDYFYLRLRLGEAYYYKQNYSTAIKHFEKALKSNSADASAQEFLYYSYLFSGRESDVDFYGAGLPEAEKKDVSLKKNTLLKNVYFETGPCASNNSSKNGNINMEGSNNLGGNADLTNNLYYAHLGLNFSLCKWLSVYPAINYINDEKLGIFQMTQHSLGGRSIQVSDAVVVHPGQMGHPPFTSYDTIYDIRQTIMAKDTSLKVKYNLKQLEFYLKCNIHVAKGLDIIPFFHLLSISTSIFKSINRPVNYFSHDSTIMHTQVPRPPMSYADTIVYRDTSFLTPLDRYSIKQADTSYYNYSLGLSVNKNWGKVSTALFASFSNLNNKKQKEEGLVFTWYPEGNLNLYFSSTLTALQEGTVKHIIFNQIAGTKINSFIWIEGFATLGSFSDFTESNGFVVDNNPDLVKFRCGIKPIFIFKKFDISLTYQFIEKEGSFISNFPQNTYTTNSIKYKNSFIIGGIKWKL
jgi:tetratricopeptide (TPR) repeat protein